MSYATKIIAFTLFLVASHSTKVFASEAAVAQFEKIVSEAKVASKANSPVYYNASRQAWAKRKFKISNVAYDVKKTESLVNPIVAIVTMGVLIEQTDLFAEKTAADAAVTYSSSFSSPYSVTLKYSYKGGGWVFLEGVYESLSPYLKGKIFTLTEENIRSDKDSVPAAVLIYCLPSR